MRPTSRSVWLSKLKLVLIAGVLLAGLARLPVFRDAAGGGPAHAQAAAAGPITASGPLSPTVEGPGPGLPGPAPADAGVVEYRPLDAADLTDQQRQAIQSEIDRNIQRLGLQRPLAPAAFSTSLAWPIRANNGLADYGYHGISAFVDHNPAAGQLLDWQCGTRTYDLTGYNHAGTDIFTWPFGWNKMDNDEVAVIAAAPGTIVGKQDGNADRSCAMNSNPWNAIYILHADGSVAWYGHMKRNSVTLKIVGDTVAAGEYLGIVGSSGSSTGPHLHLELHTNNGSPYTVIDPFAGSCSPGSSWWAAQRPYYDSAVNALTTGTALPVFPSCPNPAITNTRDQFDPGDTVYFITYYRDQVLGQQSQYKIYKPDGAVYQSWTTTVAAAYYSAAYWYYHLTLGANVPLGQWKFEVVYNGQTYQHLFRVGNPLTLALTGAPANHAIHLGWELGGSLPLTNTWQIVYAGPTGVPPSPITGLGNATWAYTVTGLTNYTWYTFTLSAMDGATPVLTGTAHVMPTDIFVFLPVTVR